MPKFKNAIKPIVTKGFNEVYKINIKKKDFMNNGRAKRIIKKIMYTENILCFSEFNYFSRHLTGWDLSVIYVSEDVRININHESAAEPADILLTARRSAAELIRIINKASRLHLYANRRLQITNNIYVCFRSFLFSYAYACLAIPVLCHAGNLIRDCRLRHRSYSFRRLIS